MKSISKLFTSLHNDESGAAFIEYTVLLGILLVGALVTIGLVGTWAGAKWVSLEAALP